MTDNYVALRIRATDEARPDLDDSRVSWGTLPTPGGRLAPGRGPGGGPDGCAEPARDTRMGVVAQK